ncbi:hypothetical protein LTS15_002105, partial [Exophiala xenobiotica]
TYTGSYPSATSSSTSTTSSTASPAPTTKPSTKASSSSTPIGTIVGAVVGGVCALLLGLILGVLVWKRKKPKTKTTHGEQRPEVSNTSPPKAELETVLSSPEIGVGVPPSYTERRASSWLVGMEEPEAQELEANGVRWSRTPEVP